MDSLGWWRAHQPQESEESIRQLAKKYTAPEFCNGFYLSLNTNRCVNQKQTFPPQGTTWCYVSADCKSLNGGASVNDRASWKTCLQSQDQDLTTMPFEEYMGMGTSNDWNMGVAWPAALNVSAYTMDSEDGKANVQARNASSPTEYMWGTLEHHPPNFVLRGSSVWQAGVGGQSKMECIRNCPH